MFYCCPNCFTDKYIQDIIGSSGSNRNCNFCLTKGITAVDPSILRPYFEPLILLYAPIHDFPKKYRKLLTGKTLAQNLIADWGVFNLKASEVQNILDCIFPDLKDSEIFTQNVALLMKASSSSEALDRQLEESWQEFTNELKEKNRFFPSKELDLEKLELLLQNLDTKLRDGQVFYRARISDNDKKIFKKEMGTPPVKKARGGRGNPFGIPYLYLASDINTAISEVRPSILDYITIGEFELQNNIQVIDLRYVSPFNFSLSEDFENLVFNIGYLQTLGSDLSKPVNPRDAELEYLPTQYLCEFIKSRDWDGVIYRSSLAAGYNVALFSESNVECSKTFLYHVNKPSYNYKRIR